MSQINPVGARSLVLGERSLAIQAVWVGAFTALTTVGAYIEIPKQPVPFTLQSFFVLLAGAVLGKRNGALSQLLYLAIGALGAPVFSSGGFGLTKLLGPTGGYLLSFPVAAFVVGYLLESNRSLAWTLITMIVGSFVIFSLGTVHLYLVFYRDWGLAFANGFMIFSLWDGVKILATTAIANQFLKRRPKSD